MNLLTRKRRCFIFMYNRQKYVHVCHDRLQECLYYPSRISVLPVPTIPKIALSTGRNSFSIYQREKLWYFLLGLIPNSYPVRIELTDIDLIIYNASNYTTGSALWMQVSKDFSRNLLESGEATHVACFGPD